MVEKVKKALEIVSATLPILLLLSTILNLWLGLHLAPLAQSDAIQIEKIAEAEEQIQQIQENVKTHVTQTDLQLLITRVDHISSRVDAIYNIVATRK